MDVSPLTLNRLSIYLRCLRALQQDGVERISSKDLAERFHLSAPQIRKDLTCFGDFGIRGVGYEVNGLVGKLTTLLGLDRRHCLAIVGMGSLGSALARHVGTGAGPFSVAAGFDNDPVKIGQRIAGVVVKPVAEIAETVAAGGIELGIVAVPPAVAQETYDRLVAAGVRSILNFAPARLQAAPDVHTRNVDLRIYLEELVFYLDHEPAGWR
jgi:redox-sensing transcriptional repressor